jgi:hypothetical protein
VFSAFLWEDSDKRCRRNSLTCSDASRLWLGLQEGELKKIKRKQVKLFFDKLFILVEL